MARERKSAKGGSVGAADAWLMQAKDDIRYAKSALREGFYSHVCFISQQIAEKAVKSAILRKPSAFPFTPSLIELLPLAKLNGRLAQAASELDPYYVTARYPLGIGQLAPFQMFNKEQAVRALTLATLFVSNASLGKTRKSR